MSRRGHARTGFAAALGLLALAACTTTPQPHVGAAASACADVDFPIYFAEGSDQLSDPARQAVLAGAGQVRGCRIDEVDVYGLADSNGPADKNLELSRRRAAVVAKALADSGLPAPLFDVKGLGESSAKSAKGRPALLQRKTEVLIRVVRA